MARADAYTVRRTSITALEVLANDTDPGGDLNRRSLRQTSDPAQGEVWLDYVNSRFFFKIFDGTPDVVSFTYRVCDDGWRCSTATVTITIV